MEKWSQRLGWSFCKPRNASKLPEARRDTWIHSSQSSKGTNSEDTTVQTYPPEPWNKFLFKPPICGSPGKPMCKRIHILVASLSKMDTEAKLNVASPKIRSVQ